MTFQCTDASLLKNTLSDLSISLANIPCVTWRQVEILTKFLPDIISATSPSTPTSSHSFNATNFTPILEIVITENNLYAVEAISLFLTQSNSKFGDQLFQTLLSFLQNAIHAKWSRQQNTHFIAFFFKQAVARIRWLTEECQNLTGKPTEEFFELISRIFSEVLQKLEIISDETIPMLIGIYQGLSVPKKEVLIELEMAGVNVINMELTLSEQDFKWARCENVEVMERIVDASLRIVQHCRDNIVPDGFAQEFSTYSLHPTAYMALSHLLTTNPLSDTSCHFTKLTSDTKSELTKLTSAYKEVRSGQELKYYSSFQFRMAAVMSLSVSLVRENSEEMCELFLESLETKLKASLDQIQFGVKLHAMSALCPLARKNSAIRVSIFEAILPLLESSFIARLSQSMQREWSSLKIPELDQIPIDIFPRKNSVSNQNGSLDEFLSGLVALCVACQGADDFEVFIGRLSNRLMSLKLDTDFQVLQSHLTISLLLRIAIQSNLLFIVRVMKGYITHSHILGGIILYELGKIFDFSPPNELILECGNFLIDVLSVSKSDSFRELAKKGILNLLKCENSNSVEMSVNFALKSFEKLVSCLSECVKLDKNSRSKEIALISSWIGIVSQCVVRSGSIGDTNDLRVLTLFRDFWLLCVVLDIVSRSDQLKPLQTIASCTPIFSNKDSSNFFAFLKASSLSDKTRLSKATISHLRPQLIRLIDSPIDVSSKLHRLDHTSVIFLTSLFHIDTMRLQNSTPKLPTILYYCENRVIQHQSSDFHKVVCVMANQILSKGVTIKVAQVPATLSRDLELESFAIMVIPRICTLDTSVRDLASHTFNTLLTQFPHLYLNKKLLFTLFNVHTLLFESLTIARGRSIFHLDPTTILGTEFILNLPDSLDKKKNIFIYFEGELIKFFKSAFEYSAENVLALIQSYLIQCPNSHLGVPGVIHATYIFNQSDFVKASLDPLELTHDTFLALNSPLETTQKLQTFGKVKSEMQRKDFLQNLLQVLGQSDFIHHLEAAICHLAITHDQSTCLFESIFRNTVRNFDLESVSFLLRNLIWLIGMSPDYETQIFSHSCQLLLVTKEKKLGMFTEYDFSDGKVSFENTPLFDTQILAHRELVIFIENRFKIWKDKSVIEMELLVNLLSSILGVFLGPKGIPSQPIIPLASTVGTIFRLLFICLSVLGSQSISDTLDSVLLRKRIYITALHYFSFETDWPKQVFEVLHSDIEVLSRFWSTLRHESHRLSECNSIPIPDQIDIDEIIISREYSSACASPDLTTEFSTQRSLSFGNLTVDYSNTHQNSSKSSRKSNRSHRSLFSSKSTKSARSSQRASPPLSFTNESVFETSADSYRDVLNLEKLILIQILHSELLKLASWTDPLKFYVSKNKYFDEVESFTPVHLTKKKWAGYLQHLWHLSPYLALQTLKRLRIPIGSPGYSELSALVSNNPTQVIKSSYALELFLNKTNLESDRNELAFILYWQRPTIIFALTLFTPQFPRHPLTAQLSHSVLLTAERDQLIFHIPQIVQALRTDQLGFVWHSIVGAAKKSQLFAHQIIWNMKTNKYTDENSEHPDEQLFHTLDQLIRVILSNLSGKSLDFYEREIAFFNKITGISGKIRHIPIGPLRDQACLEHFSKVVPEIGVYIPSNPEFSVVGIDHESAKPMQSAEKAPFRAKFKVKKFDLETQDSPDQSNEVSNSVHWQACIFKVGDDIRQDMLALQIMSLFKCVLEEAGLELYLKPYKVVCTESGCGIIECVPNAISRDQLGRKTDTNLYDYFLATFGDVLSDSFKEARINFIKSLAAYSIFSYLIQIKDRHNGNILITNEGHIIHIDFGFMFESSPGGNLGFEPHVKLTQEMLLIMGGDVNAAPYIWFRELCVRGYLALRPYCDEVVRMVTLMLDTKLPCFRGNTLEPLKARFSPGATEKQAISTIIKIIDDSLLNIRTKGYDLLQKIQNHIAS